MAHLAGTVGRHELNKPFEVTVPAGPLGVVFVSTDDGAHEVDLLMPRSPLQFDGVERGATVLRVRAHEWHGAAYVQDENVTGASVEALSASIKRHERCVRELVFRPPRAGPRRLGRLELTEAELRASRRWTGLAPTAARVTTITPPPEVDHDEVAGGFAFCALGGGGGGGGAREPCGAAAAPREHGACGEQFACGAVDAPRAALGGDVSSIFGCGCRPHSDEEDFDEFEEIPDAPTQHLGEGAPPSRRANDQKTPRFKKSSKSGARKRSHPPAVLTAAPTSSADSTPQ